VVLFDTLCAEQLPRIGGLIDKYASAKRPLFSVGSSGIEMALAANWHRRTGVAPVSNLDRLKWRQARRLSHGQTLVGSGSCSPVTKKQIAWALKNGFIEVALNANMVMSKESEMEVQRATQVAVKLLRAGRSVIVHTTRSGSDKRVREKLKNNTAKILGTALGKILRGVLAQSKVRRLCIAGGDTSSFAARALGIEVLEMIAPLTPGAPLCRAFAPDSPADGLEVVFKGGQVGGENYFHIVERGKI
jgi:uncharacterized protein YgbK (DUF1537 family)